MNGNQIYLRPADTFDMEMLLEWANEKHARLNSFNTEIIQKEVHIKWLDNILNSKTTKLFIMMQDDTPVGEIRLEIQGNTGKLSYLIAHDHRGTGLGRKIISLLEDWIAESYNQEIILQGFVKKSNLVSAHIFEVSGYEKNEIEESYCYSKKITPKH